MNKEKQDIKILIVEDEALIAHQLKKRLQKLGYSVTDMVTNSEDTLSSLRTNPAHLVLMDIVIKGSVDGIDVADMVQHEFNIPVIFLTAYTDDETLDRAELTKAYGYLVKPVQDQELNAMIRIVLNRHKRDTELLETITSVRELGHALGTAANRLSMQVKGKTYQPIELELEKALQNDEFILQYQPQVSLETGEIHGAEALIRWQHPERGLLGPLAFIPELESTGLIHDVGEWVINTACQQAKEWSALTPNSFSVAVNISSSQIQPHRLATYLDNKISQYSLNPSALDLEITESLIMDNNPTEISVLKSLKEIGVKLSIDDFGTGYSGLSYLQNFPFDVIKIDREFIKNISNNNKYIAIVQAILNLAKSLDFQTIGEGVEHETELEFLKQHQCNLVQGFLFSRPIDAEDFTELLVNKVKYFE
jgi:EAL domain-containing protein (putative c-di-GMP-specific phosphodiesterase class I)/AmiR/NasT family two-component response regulator